MNRESRSTINIDHIMITATKSFEATKVALERLLPDLDVGIFALLCNARKPGRD